MIAIVNGGTGGGGGGGEVTELLTAGTMSQVFENLVDGIHNIAAGAYHIRLYNSGLTDITANGVTVYSGDTWEIDFRENRAVTRVDFCPSVEVVIPVGGFATYQAEYPSV